MKLQKLKVRSRGTAWPATQARAAAQPSRITPDERRGRPADAPSLTGLMLVLQRLTGRALSAIGVGVQLGNVLICAAILLLGPSVALELLP